jgi:hypothetical protein
MHVFHCTSLCSRMVWDSPPRISGFSESIVSIRIQKSSAQHARKSFTTYKQFCYDITVFSPEERDSSTIWRDVLAPCSASGTETHRKQNEGKKVLARPCCGVGISYSEDGCSTLLWNSGGRLLYYMPFYLRADWSSYSQQIRNWIRRSTLKRHPQ